MDIIDLYKKRGVENIPPHIWDRILDARIDDTELEDIDLKIKSDGPGVIILSNNTVVGCIKDYYEYREKDQRLNSNKLSNQCYLVKQHFEVPLERVQDCVNCHKRCMQKREENILRHKSINRSDFRYV